MRQRRTSRIGIEAACVLALARGDPPPSEWSPSLVDGADQESIVRLAEEHQVAPLCSWFLRQASSDSRGPAGEWRRVLAPSALARLRLSYIHHRMRNEALLAGVAELHSELRRKGIDSLFFKGPWLALQAYPDLGTRPIHDIDVGIHEADYGGAVEALYELGYRSDGGIPRTGREALLRAQFGRQVRFFAPARRPVELHFRMINVGPPSESESWVWQGRRRLAVEGELVSVPGPNAMLVHLLIHANQHAFAVLRLFHDIRFALARTGGELEVGRFHESVAALGYRAGAFHGLQLSRELAAAPVPHSLEASFRPGPMRRRVFSVLWNLPRVRRLKAPRRRQVLEAPLLYLLELGGPRDKARYLGGVLRHSRARLRLAVGIRRGVAARPREPSASSTAGSDAR